MTREEAQALVEAQINRDYEEPDDSLVVLKDETIEKPYGWVFFYQSKTFIDSGDWSFQLTGNGPVVVRSFDGTLHQLGSANPPEEEIRGFEEREGLTP